MAGPPLAPPPLTGAGGGTHLHGGHRSRPMYPSYAVQPVFPARPSAASSTGGTPSSTAGSSSGGVSPADGSPGGGTQLAPVAAATVIPPSVGTISSPFGLSAAAAAAAAAASAPAVTAVGGAH